MAHTATRRFASFGLLAGLLLVPAQPRAAHASCARGLEVEGLALGTVSRGETITVIGRGFSEGCDDGGDAGLGCGVQAYERPLQNVELRLVQGASTALLGVEDAENVGDTYGQVTWTVQVAMDARPGRVRLEADGAALTLKVES